MENLGLYLLILIIPFIAHLYVNSAYKKYSKIRSKSKKTGYEISKNLLDNNNLKDMYIVETKGVMSDHYDSKRKTVRLSNDVYNDYTIAAIAIAAHEASHAIQDKEGYSFMRLRAFIFPIVNIGTKTAYVILFLGFIFSAINLIWIAIALVSLGLLFQLVTLPVEFNASNRAKEEIRKLNIINEEELEGVNKMLKAAALTYVAGVLSSALELLRLILIFTNKND